MKKIFYIVILVIIMIFLFRPFFTGKVILEKEKIGYCPTMYQEAVSFSEKNNLKLVRFNSASEVLHNLNKGEIKYALIGRKSESSEISKKIKETTIKSGYTLISKEKQFIQYSELPSIEVYTYLPKEIVLKILPKSKINYIEKNKIFEKINQEKLILISWDDWKDDFELVVVMNGNEKVKDFRGFFLYENKDL
jgi:hypothetical protein